jgi:hypothetical protein
VAVAASAGDGAEIHTVAGPWDRMLAASGPPTYEIEI